jgi:hypothetical protein
VNQRTNVPQEVGGRDNQRSVDSEQREPEYKMDSTMKQSGWVELKGTRPARMM